MSIRTEFKDRPKRVKEIFLASATDLGRERYFQGYGLVDVIARNPIHLSERASDMSIDFPDEVVGYPFFPVEFDKRAHRVDDAQVDAVMAQVRDGGITDLVVLAHGWNNDERQALRLYKNLMGNVAGQAGRRLDDRTVAVLGVFWPSKKFADEELIAGGAAAFGSDLPESALVAEIEALRGVFDIDDADQVLNELVIACSRPRGRPGGSHQVR